MLFMVVVPLILCSIALGVAELGDVRRLGRVGAVTISFFVLTTAFAALSLPIFASELLISALSSGGGGYARWPRWIPWEWWQWAFPAWLAIASAVAAAYRSGAITQAPKASVAATRTWPEGLWLTPCICSWAL